MVPSNLQPLSTSDEGILSWTVFGPKRLFQLPRNRSMKIKFRFVVKNKGNESRRVKVQLESPSRILLLHRTHPKRMSKSRLYARITNLSHAIEHSILPGKQATYDFQADYSPHLTSHLPRKLTLYFGIFVYDETNEVQARFGPRKINLPITDRTPPATPVDDFTI